MKKFTVEDLTNCWPAWALYYFTEILNGDYSVEEAREDLGSLVGSEFDPRTTVQSKEGSK